MFRDLELEIHYINIKNIINYEENYNFIYLPTRNRMKILITLIMRTIFRKVRTETTLKIYNTLIVPTLLYGGTAVAQLVEALRYKLEGRGFDSRWCHWNFSLT